MTELQALVDVSVCLEHQHCHGAVMLPEQYRWMHQTCQIMYGAIHMNALNA